MTGGRRLAFLGFLVAACGGDRAPGAWVEGEGYRWRPVHPVGSGGFTRMEAPRRGIEFRYDVPDERLYQNRILAEGAGVAAGDVDGDGRPDLFFAGFGVPSALYRNLGGWRFGDVTAPAGLAVLAASPVRGAALVDIDGDDDLDLIATVHGAPNRLFLNDGSGGFEEAAEAGFVAARGSTTPAVADIDGDGDLDLYVANYKTRQADDALTDSQRAELDALRPGPDGQLRVPEAIAEHYRVEFDGRFVRWWERGEVDELYLNEGAGRLRAVPPGDRLRWRSGARPDSLRDWGLAARFSDWDGDGDADLYVANDFNSPDGIWVNRGDGTFDEISPLAIRTTSLSSMAVDVADVDRDGDLDLVTTDMLARDLGQRLAQVHQVETLPEPPGVVETRLQVNRNALQLNRGDGTFAEAAYQAGIAASDWTWGALFLDADLDGLEDLLVTTGHVWDQLDGDTDQALRMSPVGGRPDLSRFPPLRQRNAAFRGLGDGRFEDRSIEWEWGEDPDISHGIAAADLDEDGDLDLVVTRFRDPPLLFRNEAAAPRILVRLRAPGPNTRGIGARITAVGHPEGPQTREIAAGGSYLSSSEPAAAFAVGRDGALTIRVRWPDGLESTVEVEAPDREVEIFHPGRGAGAGGASERAGGRIPERPAFRDVSDLVEHRHTETEFDDRSRQPLLPVSLSRLGPGVTWWDAEGDGDPDLVVGSGRGGAPVLIENRGGRFAPARPLTAPLEQDVTTLLPRPGGGGAMIAGLSVYEASSPAEASRLPALVSIETRGGPRAGTLRTVLQGSASATGPLAQADIDADGDLDLFVGGRVIPANLPRPADSWLLTADAGELRPDTARSVPFRAVGLVSGARFSDVDGDGDPDLVLAVDWGSPRLFLNDGQGGFSDATTAWGLDGFPGRWNGVAAGDFDGDGRPDLVLTGWGDNLEVPAAYRVYHGDFDRDGSYDLVEALRVADAWRPFRSRTWMAAGLRQLARVPYRVYRAATVEDLLGPAASSAPRIEVRELRHTVFLNRGDGSFEPRVLPSEAQRAPSFGVAAGDLDGDGNEDLLLVQNFYPVGPGVPRYDAGRGVWLRGDGTGEFAAVSGAASGIAVYGDARGLALADWDGDGRVDVAVGVNGTRTRLFRNETGQPGIRVRLRGPASNPEAIGAAVRLRYADGRSGPLREVASGSGYWSRDEAAVTLGGASGATGVWVRWPDGRASEYPLAPGQRRLEISVPGG